MAYLNLQSMIDMLEQLKQIYPPDTPIVMMSDAEGNDWSRAVAECGDGYINNDDDLINSDDLDDMLKEDQRLTVDDFERVILLWRA